MQDLLPLSSIHDNELQLERDLWAIDERHVLLKRRLLLLVFDLNHQYILIEGQYVELLLEKGFCIFRSFSHFQVEEVDVIFIKGKSQIRMLVFFLELHYNSTIGHHDLTELVHLEPGLLDVLGLSVVKAHQI